MSTEKQSLFRMSPNACSTHLNAYFLKEFILYMPKISRGANAPRTPRLNARALRALGAVGSLLAEAISNYFPTGRMF